MRESLLHNKTILLGVTGSIASYKAVDIASQLVKEGANVTVAITEAATKFITPFTFKTITGNVPFYDMWDINAPSREMHIELSHKADLMIVAPATASTIASIAYGLADDSVALCALASKAPLLIAPAMDHQMWSHSTTESNVNKMIEKNIDIIGPEYGRLASGELGLGRLASTMNIIGAAKHKLGKISGDLVGCRIIVTAGGTREPMDPVRYLGNRSSGKMGYAVAEAARDRGADVVLISSVERGAINGVQLVNVETTQDMMDEVHKQVNSADAIIMAAAVSDFKFNRVQSTKIKSKHKDINIHLMPNPDIIASVGDGIVKVAFAAELENIIEHATEKLQNKKVDFVVANDVGSKESGFNSDNNQVTIIQKNGNIDKLPLLSKIDVGHEILDRLINYFK
ncbi:MAG: phosphopantothenoylcysteine decarboxylase / phosphopantothenate--cysteine ligase [Chloroflexi bacterium]|jgi:phosphopantothenoylcysteine decarboxylase/phosphopantothenate--cysteine ligase|nr:MAG: phosphopantothenoylcysteine decarboxylase / phosphopantothenate--cysteine ligase [Chloroflexota bacterium]|tara:strand:- start:583 stop:1779 length:1197 start_codon:yes stop_codon:yes gene_type:complete